MKSTGQTILVCTFLAGLSVCAAPQVNVVTYHYDNARTGQNLAETELEPSNVNSDSFGKLFAQPVDGQIYGQPVELQNVAIPGKGTHNVVYVATENDSVYAFDADDNSGANASPLWHISFVDQSKGITPIPSADVGTKMIYPEIGITSTPVIDPGSSTIYVVAATKENGNYFQRFHALDVTTGAEKFGGPVVIQGSVPGSGWGSVNGMVSFDALRNNQRPALLLANNVVYIAWASHGLETVDPFHGWVIAYDKQNLKQVAAFATTPNGAQGGIWQSGDGLAADTNGNVFFMTGNGTFDAQNGGQDYGMSFVKAAANGVADYFTPFDEARLSKMDQDLGSGGAMLLPYQKDSTHPLLTIGAGKNGVLYLLDQTNLGKFHASGDQVVQTIQNAFDGHGLFSTPAYFDELLYFCAAGDVLRIFQMSQGMILPKPIATSTVGNFSFPGATPVISANANSNGIAWLLRYNPGSAQGHGFPATLFAFNSLNATRLYDSTQAGERDRPGDSIKFATPVVANGKVYFGTATELEVFGLLKKSVTRKVSSP